MKTVYEAPVATVELFEISDVITISGIDQDEVED